ncbi:MAG: NAD kinase [Bacteroidia bacterium]|jgi:NAD+ kinase
MKIAIYGRPTGDTNTEPLAILFNKLHEYNSEIIVFGPFFNYLKQHIEIKGNIKTFDSHLELNRDVDYMLSIGGDGTFLETLTFIRNNGIPVLGINTGRLGFLANVAKTEIQSAIDALVQRKFSIEKRALLSLQSPRDLFGEVNYALNELTIFKDSPAMITIHTYINGDYLNSYFADGLIIATPTGSTAYSLSCGGPIVMPGSQNYVITPVAPHNLNVRPLVISDSNTITLKVEGRSKHYIASLDSRNKTVESSVELVLKKADFHLNILQLENQNFFNTIRNKLLWGLDRRN